MILELGVELRHNCLLVPRNRNDSEFLRESHRRHELRNLHVDDRGVILQSEHRKLKFPAREIHRLSGGRVLEKTGDFRSRNLFRIEHKVNAHFRKEVFVLVRQILLIVDSGTDLLAA